MAFIDYQVRSGDTLESISENVLGDASLWRVLARINKLRAPYISDQPIDQYGSPIHTDVLTTPVSVGQTTYTMSLPQGCTCFSASNIFYMQTVSTTSAVIYDALVLTRDMDPATGVLTFQTAFTQNYLVGTTFSIFPPVREQTSTVLRPGDTLRIPSDRIGNVLAVGENTYSSLLGTDLGLATDGTLSFDATGDLATITGTPNLIQSMGIRLNTPYGSWPPYPTYGNRLYDYVGRAQTPQFFNLVTGITTGTLSADPRIDSVRDLRLTQQGNTVTLEASVIIRPGSALVRVDNLVIRL